jgi:hypothetical protein
MLPSLKADPGFGQKDLSCEFVDERNKSWCLHCRLWIASLDTNEIHVKSIGNPGAYVQDEELSPAGGAKAFPGIAKTALRPVAEPPG